MIHFHVLCYRQIYIWLKQLLGKIIYVTHDAPVYSSTCSLASQFLCYVRTDATEQELPSAISPLLTACVDNLHVVLWCPLRDFLWYCMSLFIPHLYVAVVYLCGYSYTLLLLSSISEKHTKYTHRSINHLYIHVLYTCYYSLINKQ